MSYQITWPVPHHVVMVTQIGGVTGEETEIIGRKLYEAIEAEAVTPIHVLVDVREAFMQDKLWRYTQAKLKRHLRTGFVIIVGDSRLTGLLVAIFSKLLNLHIHYNSTLDEAMKFLRERDVGVATYFT